jgi:hypothetical protein
LAESSGECFSPLSAVVDIFCKTFTPN